MWLTSLSEGEFEGDPTTAPIEEFPGLWLSLKPTTATIEEMLELLLSDPDSSSAPEDLGSSRGRVVNREVSSCVFSCRSPFGTSVTCKFFLEEPFGLTSDDKDVSASPSVALDLQIPEINSTTEFPASRMKSQM